MENYSLVLLLSTFSVGIVHTLIGPDHYLPFIALSRSRSWSMAKTLYITAACGLAHIFSAVLLGIGAAAVGSVLSHLEIIEAIRASIAAWLLTAFGFVYFVWGIRQALRNHVHTHSHAYPHEHAHEHTHTHTHTHPNTGVNRTDPSVWILMIIFIFGPCEPLIPLVMYPASRSSMSGVLAVTLIFGAATLFSMIAVVALSIAGTRRAARFPFFERYGNALAGGIICSCGLAMNFLGL